MNANQIRQAVVSAAAIITTAAAMAVEVEQSWLDRIDGPASMNDYGETIAVGPEGSIYVAGSVFEQVEPNLFAPRFLTALHRGWNDALAAHLCRNLRLRSRRCRPRRRRVLP